MATGDQKRSTEISKEVAAKTRPNRFEFVDCCGLSAGRYAGVASGDAILTI
jgi:hypothetical protein